MRTPSSSITILGAGLMGRLLAVELARAGHAVEVFDRGGPQAEHAAATVAAAMLAPLAESAVTEPNVVRMGQYALTRWPALLGALEQPVFFSKTAPSWSGTGRTRPRRSACAASSSARTPALPGLPAPEALDAAGLAAVEPALADRFAQGLYLPGEGQLDNRQLLAALAQEMQRLQVCVHWHTPREVSDFAPGTAGQPDWLIDCRGLGARTQWPALRGVRGEVLRVHAPEVTLQRPTRLVHPRYPIYIAPKQEHLFVIGATEIESEDLSPVSVRSALELLSTAYTVHSGFAEARILEIAAQCRPTLPDNLPAIRCSAPRLLEVNGLYRHGYMIAPAVLDATLEWLHTGASPLAERLGLHIVHTATHASAAPEVTP